METSPTSYRDAFDRYMRWGIPIAPKYTEKKADRPTTQYVWRTQGDRNVRSSHKANDGKVFSWDSPPATGHPGEDFGCRCRAEPYYPDITEYMDLTIEGVSASGKKWANRDFVRHYFFGKGKTVRLRDTGHLTAVVEEFMAQAGDRLLKQIANSAREAGSGRFAYDFRGGYQMQSVVFSLGDTEIKGEFIGSVEPIEKALTVEGIVVFGLKDSFTDPLDIGEAFGWDPVDLPLAVPYDIIDEWSGQLTGLVRAEARESRFR